MILRTVISVNQLSICESLAEQCKNGDKKIIRRVSSLLGRIRKLRNTLCKRKIRGKTIFPGVNVMSENARCSPGGNRTISDADTSTTSTASTTKAAIRTRRKLRSLCRSQDWMEVLQRATWNPAGSIFIFIAADFAMAN